MEFAESVEAAIFSLRKLALEALGAWKTTKYIIVPPGPCNILGPNMTIYYILDELFLVTTKTETMWPEDRMKRWLY